MTIILASDPGTKNFSTAALKVQVHKGTLKYDILRVTMLGRMVQELKGDDFWKELQKFKSEYYGLVRQYAPEYIVAERYQNRGAQRGSTGETVSLMLGVMSLAPRCKNVKLITAAQWKNEFNKHYDLKEFYEIAPLVPHAVDSISIGLYRACQVLGLKPFEFLTPKNVRMLLHKMEEVRDTILSASKERA